MDSSGLGLYKYPRRVFMLTPSIMGVAVRSGSVWVYFGLFRYALFRCSSVRLDSVGSVRPAV